VTDPVSELADIVRALQSAENDEEEEEIGRSRLAGLLLHHAPKVLDRVLTLARRDNRVRRCLSAARYYSGLDKATCTRIDQFIQAPFPAARKPRR
jgi:hypothetical protein